MCLVVVLAGCTGIGGLGGGGDDSEAAASTPGDGASGDNGEDGGSGDESGDSGDSGDSDGESGDGESGADESSDGSNADSDADDGSEGGASGASGSASLDADEEWFNLSTPGRYVFEIESAEEGTGTMSFETTEVAGGEATVKVDYELGGESFSSTVTGPVGEVEPQIAASPAYVYLIAIQLGGFGAGAVGGEELRVGDKFSQESAEGSLLIEVVGTDTYAGVECYAVETRVNGTLSQEVCTQEAFSSSPYVVIYDENGDLSERVELIEYERK